ncbi:MAG: phosphoribosylamine--glycine ligase [Chthoniobacterales bacterium]
MKILLIGSGGREHALAWKLKQSPRLTQLYIAPGNPGTASLGQNIHIEPSDCAGLLMFAKEKKIDMTIVGPDDPLALGVVDLFQNAGFRIFGPTVSGARLESSKSFAKEFMNRHGIPTATSKTFIDPITAYTYVRSATYPLVVKADGLALGKGVVIARALDEALEAVRQSMELQMFGVAGTTIVIEEFLTGVECSLHALVDGNTTLLFPDARDHKRALDGDQGPNTGGMGTVSPSGVLSSSMQEELQRTLFDPFLRGLKADGLTFAGMLFPGIMMTPQGPKVLEFNCRFGDPETQVLMRRLKSDLIDLLEATLDGTLATKQPIWNERPAVCVVVASGGYPGPIEKGKIIHGLEAAVASDPEIVLFHAGTRKEGDFYYTAGGRVLGVTATGATLEEARSKVYSAVELISFEGKQYRRDIGQR